MKKRGLSEVITTLIFILLAIIAIGIVWFVFNNIVNQNKSQISLGKITDTVKINDAKVGILQSKIQITNNGKDKMTGVKIFLSDGTNTNETNYNLNLGQYESTTITIPLTSGFQPTLVTVTPIYGNIDGQTAIKDLTQDYSIEKNNGLVAYYPFNGDAKDYSGNVYDIITNTGSFISGIVKQEINFDTNQYAKTKVIDLSSTKQVSLSFWATIPTYPSTAAIVIEMSDNFNNYQDSLVIFVGSPTPTTTGANQVIEIATRGGCGTDSGYNTQAYDKSLVNDGQPHYWTVIFDKTNTNVNNKINFYIDGALQTSIPISIPLKCNTINNFGSREFYIASRGGVQLPLTYNLDELAIFNRSLTTQEIQQIYNSQK